MNKKWFRNPENFETINYDCGCVYTIILSGTKSASGYKYFGIEVSNFCFEHDPTLTEYAKENKDEFIAYNY